MSNLAPSARRVIIPYAPRPLQREVHDTRQRFAVLVCHRRFGKTVFAVNDLLREALRRGDRHWRAGYLAPWLKQSKSLAWDYLKVYAGHLPGVRFSETELWARLPNGARIRLYGADNADAIRGEYFNDLVVDESGDIPRAVWGAVLRPALADRRGRALFLGTPRGTENLLHDRWQVALAAPETWSSHLFRASETGYVAHDELALARQDMAEEEYEQEFECSFTAAVRGTYYGKLLDEAEREGRIGQVAYDPALAVHTAWDLGMDDATAIWFLQVSPAGEWRLIDYYEASGEGLPHYAAVLAGKGYAYGTHVGPHDIRVRELGTGKSRLDTARDLGVRFSVAPNLPLMDGISAVRQVLPRLHADAGRCAVGLKALKNYRKEWNPRAEAYQTKPLHNWTSHAADALRYGVVALRETPRGPRQETAQDRRAHW